MVPGEIGGIPEHQEVTGTPGRYMGLIGPLWERGEGSKGGGAPPKPNPNWEGGRPPFLPPSSPFLPLLVQLGKGGILLPVGVGLPMGRAIGGPALPLLHSFIYGGKGHPIDTQVDH